MFCPSKWHFKTGQHLINNKNLILHYTNSSKYYCQNQTLVADCLCHSHQSLPMRIETTLKDLDIDINFLKNMAQNHLVWRSKITKKANVVKARRIVKTVRKCIVHKAKALTIPFTVSASVSHMWERLQRLDLPHQPHLD